MTTGHLLPGYDDPVSRLRRAKSAGYPLDTKRILERTAKYYRIDPFEFNRIREEARKIWSKPDREPTTYDFYHNSFANVRQNPPIPRPASPTRINKPHPPLVFLTNRLHYIEGYQNPDTTIGKECYRVDGSVSPREYGKRRSLREKYIGRPCSAAVNTMTDKYGLKEYLDPVEAQGAKAWLDIAYDDDKDGVVCALQNFREQQINEEHKQANLRPHTAFSSLNRWMKPAVPRETETYLRESNPVKPYHTVVGTRGDLKKKTIEAAKRFRYSQNRLNRGEFMIHPEWPPSLPHHRVP